MRYDSQWVRNQDVFRISFFYAEEIKYVICMSTFVLHMKAKLIIFVKYFKEHGMLDGKNVILVFYLKKQFKISVLINGFMS